MDCSSSQGKDAEGLVALLVPEDETLHGWLSLVLQIEGVSAGVYVQLTLIPFLLVLWELGSRGFRDLMRVSFCRLCSMKTSGFSSLYPQRPDGTP